MKKGRDRHERCGYLRGSLNRHVNRRNSPRHRYRRNIREVSFRVCGYEQKMWSDLELLIVMWSARNLVRGIHLAIASRRKNHD
jgi:hypothetical protein